MPHNLADILKQLKIEVTQDPNICARKLRHRNPVLYFKIISSLRGGYKEAMFLLEHNLSSPPLCKICKSRPKSFNGKTYSNYCSIDCYRKDKDKLRENAKKVRKIIMEKYGVKNISQLEEVKQKKKETYLRKYGVDHPLKVKEIAKKSGQKIKQKYSETKKKIIKTNLERYGTEFPISRYRLTEEQKEKQRIALINHYKDPENRKKLSMRSKKFWLSMTEEEKKKFLNRCRTTLKERFKDDNFRKDIVNKRKESLIKNAPDNVLEKLGIDRNNFSLDDANKLIKYYSAQGTLKKYGVETVFKLPEFQEKCRKSIKEKYGVENISQTESRNRKLRERSFNRIKEWLSEKFIVKNIHKGKNPTIDFYAELECKNCGYNFKAKLHGATKILCPKCETYKGLEKVLLDVLDKNNISYIVRDRQLIKPYEIDIIIPDYKIAIELNGIYWHSHEIIKDKDYHFNKLKLVENQGYILFQFWEDDVLYKFDIVKSMIFSKLNLNRKIESNNFLISEIKDVQNIQKFLDENHILGFEEYDICLGLFHNDQKIAVMTFKQDGNEWIVSRYCSKLFVKVVNGEKILFDYFIRNHCERHNIIKTFIDLSYDNGKDFIEIGFRESNLHSPNIYIFEGNERKVDDKLDNSFGKYIIYGPGIKELTFNWEKL